MFYRLTDNYALRAWKYVNRVVYLRFEAAPLMVDAETFDVLLACDGEHDLMPDEALVGLAELGVVEPCAEGERPCGWSRFRRYDHRFVPNMNLMLTGKCNHNRRHCFNAAENADRMDEWGWDELLDLLDQAADCGIHAITLTMWRFLVLSAQLGAYSMILVKDKDGIYRPTKPVCSGNRTMMAVTCEGDVVPCLQMAGRWRCSTRMGARARSIIARATPWPAFSSKAAGMVACKNVWLISDSSGAS